MKFMKKLFTVKELAEATGYTSMQIYRQVWKGNIIPSFHTSRILLFSRAEFNRIVERVLKNGKYKTFKRSKKMGEL